MCLVCLSYCCVFFFFKQKTAYEMRISDWSSDVCSSELRPPLPARRIRVAGDVGIATFRMQLVNMLEGRFISPHDHDIAERIATVLCGGEVDRHSLVDEDWLLRLEREHFVALAQMPKTQARIAIGRASCWERWCQYVEI